jgi:2-polyprenyl-3-methyl-5-hydroxy-6-metoxy-1,4-benzoquinol methylase
MEASMTISAHWENVYATKPATSVSWFQVTPGPSLRALERLRLGPANSIIDVGGGASSLVDELLDAGWADLTVLDVAGTALEIPKMRLGARAGLVNWIVADVTCWRPARSYDVWHDRAVFHFLTDPLDRGGYCAALKAALPSGGHLILATFALDGPERCSGLPVQRYDAIGLATELGEGFAPVDHWREPHVTPGGTRQNFTWCTFRKV